MSEVLGWGGGIWFVLVLAYGLEREVVFGL